MSGWMIAWTRPGAGVVRHEDGKVENGFEFVVRDRLIEEKKLESFVPATRKERPIYRWSSSGGKRPSERQIVNVPALPRYILFRATDAQPDWQHALYVDGVTSVIKRAGSIEPGVLPEWSVKKLLGPNGDGIIEDLTKTIEGLETFAIETEVRITEGPFAQHIGIVVGQEKRWLQLAVSLFGRATPVELQIDQVERVA